MRSLLVCVGVLAGCSIHHRSQDFIDAFGDDDAPHRDGAVDAPPDTPPDGKPGGIGNVAGLVLWLEGGVGVTHDPMTNRVSRWADQSGHSNDALPTSDQGAPTYIADSIDHQPGVHFGLVGRPHLEVADSATLDWGTTDFVVEVVVEFTNAPPGSVGTLDATPCFYQKGATATDGIGLFGNAEAGAGASGRIGQANGTGTARTVRVLAPLNNGTPHAIALRRAGDNLELRVDGTVAATTSGAKNVDISNASPASIGSLFGGQGLRVDGDIAEVVAVRGPSALTQIDLIESYLTSKYGL